MEKVCEFCMSLMPVVYCPANAAHLCLSCDAKVHSANALSYRHLRILLCYSCRCSPAYTDSLDDKIYVCNICDRWLHNGPSQHRKCNLHSYMGSPSANELAMMRNMDLSGSSSNARMDALISSALAASVSSISSFAYRQSAKVSQKGRLHQSSCLILQQILDLRRLQSSERNESSPVLRDQVKNVISQSCLTADWTQEDTGPDMQTRLDLSTETDGCGEPPVPKLAETCLPPFSQLENFTITSLPGETFWQLRSPQSNQRRGGFDEGTAGGGDVLLFCEYRQPSATSDDGNTNGIGQAASRDALVLQGDATSNQSKMDWGNKESFRSLWPSYPTMFLSLSRLRSESITNDSSVNSNPLQSNAGGGGRLSNDTIADHPRHEKRTWAVPRRVRTAMRKRIRRKSSKREGIHRILG